MYNHFRTLLLNETYTTTTTTPGPGNIAVQEYIPASFRSIILPSEIQQAYDLFIPPSSSRFFKTFLVWNYLQLIKASGLYEDIKRFDPRIIEPVDQSSSFFKFNRISNVIFDTGGAAAAIPIVCTDDSTQHNISLYFDGTYYVAEVDQTGGSYVDALDYIRIRCNADDTVHKLSIRFDGDYYLLEVSQEAESSSTVDRSTLVYTPNRTVHRLNVVYDGEYYLLSNELLGSQDGNSLFPMHVTGTYASLPGVEAHYDTITVTMTGSNTVSIYSAAYDEYFKAPDGTTNFGVVFPDDGKFSSAIQIGSTGLALYFESSVPFSAIMGKQWTFIAEGPLEFKFDKLIERLNRSSAVISAMLKYPCSITTETHENYWNMHYNPVYKVAGLLIALVSRMNKLRA